MEVQRRSGPLFQDAEARARSEAPAAWERFLEIEPTARQAGMAQKAIALCRMKIQQERTQTG
jgi:hypothetical protein